MKDLKEASFSSFHRRPPAQTALYHVGAKQASKQAGRQASTSQRPATADPPLVHHLQQLDRQHAPTSAIDKLSTADPLLRTGK